MPTFTCHLASHRHLQGNHLTARRRSAALLLACPACVIHQLGGSRCQVYISPGSCDAQRLKEEGNKFFGLGKYSEAAAKYEKVKSELAGIRPTSPLLYLQTTALENHCPCQ